MTSRPAQTRHALRPSAKARLAQFFVDAANVLLRASEFVLFPRVPREPRRVGVWRVGMIGDTLAALPAVATVRARHPGAEVVLFTSPGPDAAPGARELLGDNALVDTLVRWSREELQRHGARGLVQRLSQTRVERLYVLPQDRSTLLVELRNLIVLRLAGQRGVRGARLASAEFLPRWLRAEHDRTSRAVPEAQRLLELVGEPDSTADVAIIDDTHAARAARTVQQLAPAGEALLCIAPGGKLEHKRWSPERFGRAARAWCDAGGAAVILGGPGDVELAAAVARAAGLPLPHLCGTSDLLDSAALLARADALLTNDTGTMHLAATVGAPLVAIFSGWDRVGAWDPWQRPGGGAQVVLRAPTACAPCRRALCDVRIGSEPACLAGVSVERAVAALLDVARRAPSRPAAVA